MRRADDPLGPMPFGCPSLLAEPVEFEHLRRRGIVRVPTVAGHSGWLVTGAADMRELSAGFQVGKSHPDPATAPRLWQAALFEPQSNFDTEVEDHQRWRSALAASFGVRRVQRFRPRAQRILTGLVDEMVATGSSADLGAAVIRPFAARALLEFVGFPVDVHRLFVARSRAIRAGSGAAQVAGLSDDIKRYARQLMRYRERHPDDDVVSAAATGGPWKSSAERLETVSSHAITEYETIAARIEYGMLFLFANPAQLQNLCRDPALVVGAVEEILRMAVPGGSWIPRYARTDLDHHGARIRAGELVVFAVQSANRDSARFTDVHAFDIRRSPNRHLGFGAGKFFCLGAAVSRMMLDLVLSTLTRRLPSLRLDVPLGELHAEHDNVTGGISRLPVMW